MSSSARHAVEGSRLRRIGYRLFPGTGFDYLLHMRPREWPIMIAHTSLGYFLAPGTIYRHVRKLLPGHWLRLRAGRRLSLRPLPPSAR